MVFEDLKQSSGESTLWIFRSSFYENDDWAAWKDWFNFREPHFLVRIILFSVFLNFCWQFVKDQSDVFWLFVPFKNFFICLGNNDSRGCLDIKLAKSFWTLSGFKAEVSDMVVSAEDIDRVGEVAEELFGLWIGLWVKQEDYDWAKIVQEVSE